MNTNTLALASHLSDHDLLAHLVRLASAEREASAELVAHLAALDLRPSVYAALGYGSLFDYCTGALRLSEDAACSRIAVARACRRLPAILDALASGDVSLTSVRLLAPHLTPENHRDVLAAPHGKAAVTPPPDAPSRSIRPETDRPPAQSARKSRYRPRHVDRAAWTRDDGQCGFVSKEGRRCTERAFLEFHHIQPFALGGPATVENISLRCRRHNQYEADRVFGPRGVSEV
jgi:HNH endonuclease